jgi:ATP-binding cassette, subfamily B, bacterial
MRFENSSATHSKKSNDSALKCMHAVIHHYGNFMSIVDVRSKSNAKNNHLTLKDVAETAESLGLRAHCVSVNFAAFAKEITLPCIVKWDNDGFVVVKKIVQNQILIGTDKDGVTISKTEFCKNWLLDNTDESMVLTLEPSPEFYRNEDTDAKSQPQGLRSLLVYLKKYPKLVWQLAVGLIVGTLIKLTLPFLTQSIVDVGVMNNNLNFIYLFLAGQLMLMVGRNALEAIRGWLQLYVSSRVGILILTDFVAKVMRLPVSYFNEKAVGEVMQRVEDQKRIETFLASHLSNILFSITNLVIYTAIFALYDMSIFTIFFGATLCYIGWVTIFMKKRRQYDFNRTQIAEQEQNKLVQIVQGMPDIKLANAEIVKRWDWEKVRARLFLQNIKLLKLSQGQQIGGNIINEAKTLIITFLSAKAVLEGNLSLGAMLAIQQMLGQTNSATEQLFAYFQQLQDARLSTERLNKVHQMPEEEPLNYAKTSYLPENQPIILRHVNFQYPNANTSALRDIKLFIPAGKTTAIVGSSGSGKTTLLKLLMKHYAPDSGQLALGKMNFNNISTRSWRSKCGVVMSDGVIFTDTILNNIALGDDDPSMDRVRHAAKVANIHEWIETRNLGYHTPIGGEHGSISHGQKQRLLIARAVYKDPEFLFFDEGTSALDVQNQQTIMRNLEDFFHGRTVVVVAHRLSTIRNADQIVVIEEGQIIEKGTHDELLSLEGRYYELLTTQLEAAV